jgi:hypothetical protein
MPDNRFTKSSQIEFVAAAASVALTTRAVVCTDGTYTVTLPAACEMEPGTIVTVAAAAHTSQSGTITISEARAGVHPLSSTLATTTYVRVLISDGLSWHIS